MNGKEIVYSERVDDLADKVNQLITDNLPETAFNVKEFTTNSIFAPEYDGLYDVWTIGPGSPGMVSNAYLGGSYAFNNPAQAWVYGGGTAGKVRYARLKLLKESQYNITVNAISANFEDLMSSSNSESSGEGEQLADIPYASNGVFTVNDGIITGQCPYGDSMTTLNGTWTSSQGSITSSIQAKYIKGGEGQSCPDIGLGNRTRPVSGNGTVSLPLSTIEVDNYGATSGTSPIFSIPHGLCGLGAYKTYGAGGGSASAIYAYYGINVDFKSLNVRATSINHFKISSVPPTGSAAVIIKLVSVI